MTDQNTIKQGEASSPTAAKTPVPRGRPADKSGKRNETRERLIRCGIEILTEKGFASTGIDQILKQVGIPKGSFYHYFASKDEFGSAVIQGYAAYFAAKLDRWLLNPDRAPLDRIQDFIDDAKQGMQRHEFQRGCLVGNMGQEMGGYHEQFRNQLELVFIDWQSRLEACLIDARNAGQIAQDTDCAALSAFFWTGWEGAILRAKLVRSTAPMDLFADTFFKICHPK
jgi:TetR/AcrR family transcriptional repressor of nem operon